MKKFLGNLLVVTFITYGFLIVIVTYGGVAAVIIYLAHKQFGVAGAIVAALLLVGIVIYFKYKYEINEWIRDNLPGSREGRGPRRRTISYETCPECHGIGRIPCEECGGKGTMEIARGEGPKLITKQLEEGVLKKGYRLEKVDGREMLGRQGWKYRVETANPKGAFHEIVFRDTDELTNWVFPCPGCNGIRTVKCTFCGHYGCEQGFVPWGTSLHQSNFIQRE